MFAVVKTGGKQYKIAPGQLLTVDRLAGSVDDEIRLDEVLMLSGDSGITIGTPAVVGAAIRATIVDQTKGEKLRVFKYKSKKRYRKTRGHRSQLTTIKIEEILQG